MSWPNRLLTLEEWEPLPENEGVRLELAEGLVVMSPTRLSRPNSLTAYVLVDGDYELSGEHTATADLDVAGHPVTVDLAALTRR